MGNRGDYQHRQDQFYEQVGKIHGLERGERRDPAERKAHTTKREWQEAKQAETISQQAALIKTQQAELAKVQQAAQKTVREDLRAQKALDGKLRKIEKLTEQVEKKIVARPPGIFEKKDTIEFHRNMYDSVRKNLYEMRQMTKEIASSSDTLDWDRERAQADRKAAAAERREIEQLKEQELDRINTLAQRQFEKMAEQAKDDWRMAKEAKERQERLLSATESNIREQAIELANDLIKGEETAVERRMRSHMASIAYSDGTTVLDSFERKERELKERIARHAHEWSR
jgi:hypothetical protein